MLPDIRWWHASWAQCLSVSSSDVLMAQQTRIDEWDTEAPPGVSLWYFVMTALGGINKWLVPAPAIYCQLVKSLTNILCHFFIFYNESFKILMILDKVIKMIKVNFLFSGNPAPSASATSTTPALMEVTLMTTNTSAGYNQIIRTFIKTSWRKQKLNELLVRNNPLISVYKYCINTT